MRLQSPPAMGAAAAAQAAAGADANGDDRRAQALNEPAPPYVPGEFERFVQRQAGPDVQVRRFGPSW